MGGTGGADEPMSTHPMTAATTPASSPITTLRDIAGRRNIVHVNAHAGTRRGRGFSTCRRTNQPGVAHLWRRCVVSRRVAGWLSPASAGILFIEVSVKDAPQEQRAIREREANARAAAAGEPLPFPNPWDAV